MGKGTETWNIAECVGSCEGVLVLKWIMGMAWQLGPRLAG